MNSMDQSNFINGLIIALRKERASQRVYILRLLKGNRMRIGRNALLSLAETEHRHSEKWSERLAELGVALPLIEIPWAKRFGAGHCSKVGLITP